MSVPFAPRPVPPRSRHAVLLGSAMGGWLAAAMAPAAHAADPAAADPPVAEVVVTDSAEAPEGPEGSARSGYRARTGTLGPLGRTALKDTPYSVNVTSGELIANSNAHSVADALRTNPTATLLMSSAGYSSMSRMMVRGFTAADQSETRDGLVDRSFSYVPIENVERIEVLNGFSGFLGGFSALGGTVNYVTKQPTAEPTATTSAGVYGGGIAFAHADLGGPVAATDGKLGYRVNAYREDGGSYVEGSEQERTLVSMRLDYDAAPGTRLWTDMWHQTYDARGLQSYFALGSGVKVPDADKFDANTQYGQRWTWNKTEKTQAGAGIDSELTDFLSVRGGYRYAYMWRDYGYVANTLTDNSGNYSETAYATPRQHEATHSEYALADIKGRTWGVDHTLTTGYTGTDYVYDRGADVSRVLGTSSVSAPTTYADPGLSLGGKNQWQKQNQDNYLLGDRVAFGDQWSALVGVTHAVLKQQAWGPGTTISTSNFTKKRSTPTYALMFKPVPAVTTYASYMEALVGGESSSTAGVANRYQVLPPSVSEQYETGVKASIGGFDVNAALFRIDKVNAEIDPADKVFKQDGREIHQGLEVMATGKLTDRLAVVGGFTWMDAHVEKASANPAVEDKIPVNVPEQQARLYLEYALPFVDNLTLTGGANYYGKRPVDALNTGYIDAAATFDAGLRYDPEIYGHKTTFTLNVTNLFDTAYWAYFRSGDGLLLGAPRVVSASVRTTW